MSINNKLNNISSNSSEFKIDYSSSDSESKSNELDQHKKSKLDNILNEIVFNSTNTSTTNNISLNETNKKISNISISSNENLNNDNSPSIKINLLSSSDDSDRSYNNNTTLSNVLDTNTTSDLEENNSNNDTSEDLIISYEKDIDIDTEKLYNLDTEQLDKLNVSNLTLKSTTGTNTSVSDSNNLSSSKSTQINIDENNSNKESNVKDDNSLIIQLFDPYNKNSKNNNEISDSDSEILISSQDINSDKNSVISNNSNDNDVIIASNKDSSSDLILSNSINSDKSSNNIKLNENQRSIGTNTNELVMTLKIPFDSSKIIPVENVNIQDINNINIQKNFQNNFEEKKQLELQELKKKLIKRNEIKMQKMFDMLLEKHNDEVDDEIFKSSMGIPLDKISDNNTIIKKQNITKKINKEVVNSNNIKKNIIEDSKTNSDSNLSDPYHMDYKFADNENIPKLDKNGKLIIPHLNNLDSEEKNNLQQKRKEEIINLTKNNNSIITNDSDQDTDQKTDQSNKSEENKNSNNSENKNSVNSENKNSVNSENKKSNNSEDNKEDDYEKRKKLRKERYLQRKKNKNNIINQYFDMVYIICMKEDQDNINELINILNDNKVKYIISDGIDAKKNTYFKYVNRWRYQLGDTNIKLSKQLFDYDIYIKKNPDLLKGKINNKSRAWHHWVTTGQKENRKLYEKSNIKNISQIGCLLAHNRVIIDSIKKKYENILVLEDDIYFIKDFFNNFTEYMNTVPKKWNLLYLGCTQKKWSNIKLNDNKKYYIPDSSTYGAFGYGINKNLFEEIKNICFELIEPFDKCLQKLYRFRGCFVMYPNVLITNLDKSKIHRTRDINKYGKIFRWNLESYDMDLYNKINNNKNDSENDNETSESQ